MSGGKLIYEIVAIGQFREQFKEHFSLKIFVIMPAIYNRFTCNHIVFIFSLHIVIPIVFHF